MTGWSPWRGRKYFLDKMTLRDLVRAYVTYPAIQVYALLFVLALPLALLLTDNWLATSLAALATVLVYPLVEYLLHRYVLHARWLYRNRWTAALWKRIHFDHHQDPNDLGVLFGALRTTLSTIVVITLPLGWAIGGPAGAAAAFATALPVISIYEFCHCIQHLPFTPRWGYLREIKKRHLAHHFHSEKGNFGITSYGWDKLLGTYYESPKSVARSDTVYNLGYRGQEVVRYPWVAELSGLPTDGSGDNGRKAPAKSRGTAAA